MVDMANFSDLPTEIRFLIAQYMSKWSLFKLKSLNSFFLHCWINFAWKHVRIDTEDTDKAVRLLQRVVDPFVATRARTLTISLEHDSPSQPAFQAVLALALQTVPRLPNVTSLGLELFQDAITLFPTLCHTITSSSMARTLRKLFLSGYLEMFASLIDYSVHATPFENLVELGLILIDPQDVEPVSNAQNISSVTLAPFLLSLSSTLQYLRISNWLTNLDFSPLFDALSPSDGRITLPNLTSLVLILLPFDTSLQSSPPSLHRFLLAHNNNLQHFKLRLEISSSHSDPDVEAHLGAWLTEFVNNNDAKFPSLQSLEIYPSSTPAGLSALLQLIKRIAPTLSSLVIRSRYLTSEEAKAVLDTLARIPKTECEFERAATTGSTRLKSLKMNIIHLSVPFLDLLSCKAPQLEQLFLGVSEIVGSDQQSFSDLLHQRRYDRNITSTSISTPSTRPDILHTWKLRDLMIWKAGKPMDDAVRMVACAVPSVIVGGVDDDDE